MYIFSVIYLLYFEFDILLFMTTILYYIKINL